MRTGYDMSRLSIGVGFVVAFIGMLVLAVTPAAAGIGGSDVPTWPVSATVGDIINVSITIVNGSTTPNNTEDVVVDNFAVNPSCKSSANAICLGGNVDPGVFHTLAGGQGVGDASTPACAGTLFNISPPLPDGGLVLTPTLQVTLGRSDGVVNLSCQVNFALRVFKMPANPATNALTGVQLHGANSGLTGVGTGAAQITIAKATPTLATLSNPNAGTVVPGTAVSDTVTVTKAPGAILPTGSVRFVLCQPGDVTAGGCVSPAGVPAGVVPPDVALSAVPPISATSNTTSNTFAIGTYCWRARYLGDANYNAVNHTDAVAECFTTVKQPSHTATLSFPTGGNVAVGSPVTDVATVTGGAGQPTPTGSVTFFLCQPGDVTPGTGCVAPAGTQVGTSKTLNVNGKKVSDATSNTLTVGTYCWRVTYSGDGFYLPSDHTDAANECFTTVNLIHPPTITTQSNPTVGPGGTSVTDTATVTGGVGEPTATGTVTFFLCQPNEVDATGCPAGAGSQVGAVKTLSGGTATSDATTDTTTPGKYCWRVNYSGDGFYQQGSHTNTNTECFVVVPDCDIYYEYQSSNPLTSVEFNENEVLRAFRPNLALAGGTIQMFYNDEHTLTLGISQVSVKTSGGTTVTNCALSAFPGASPPCDPVPGVNGAFACHVVNPDVGTTANPPSPADDATCVQNNVDPSGRPLYPALFITDLTQNGPTACSPAWAGAPPAGTFCGDWQFAGVAQTPDDVFGTWKGATILVDKTKVPTAVTFTKGADTKKNNYVLGPGSDPVPFGLINQGYGSEVRWNVNDLKVDTSTGTGTNAPLGGTVLSLSDPSLVGHTFRIQFMVHDGDQNKAGGDVGQDCMNVFMNSN